MRSKNLFQATALLLPLLFSFTLLAHNHTNKALVENPENTDIMASSLEISDAWARATFALAKTGAAYLTATNTSSKDITLSAISVSKDVAMTAEIHHTVMKDDMMQMQELSDGVKIKAGETVEFVPGGKHLMLMGLTGPLNKGETVAIKMVFEDGSTSEHTFPILDRRNATH